MESDEYGVAARIGMSPARLERIDALCRSYIERERLAGTVTLVARRGEVVHFQAHGTRDRERALPMMRDTLFRIYSMTKPITTVAALMLYEQGHFLLEDPVAKYLPVFAEARVCTGMGAGGPRLERPRRPPTVGDLMSHTAGLGYGWFQDSPVEERYRALGIHSGRLDLAQAVEAIGALPLLYHPGSAWRYSFGTDVLGRLVEVWSGQTLEHFFTEQIFAPLGMKDTAFQVPEGEAGRLASLYSYQEHFDFSVDFGRPPPSETRMVRLEDAATSRYLQRPALLSGGGGLVSTAPDYLRFCQMLLSGGVLDGTRLLGRKAVELMRTNRLPAGLLPIAIGGVRDPGYGFGLGVRVLVDLAASSALGSPGMYGWGGAATTGFWVDPAEALIGIFMTQFLPSGHYPVVQQFQRAVYQALVD